MVTITDVLSRSRAARAGVREKILRKRTGQTSIDMIS